MLAMKETRKLTNCPKMQQSTDKLFFTSIQHLKSFLKITLGNELLKEWHNLWDRGDTSLQVFAVIPRVSLGSSNWDRKDTIFFSAHGPIPNLFP
ncbi:hypothetical protein AVEN_178670-1 [Araneus ventricosus]|uniref:Uncharacterized protein n=1 Tax=Araneus ventricosus TaxID=182803 RepID=A0A4Y2I8L7_ARAVE|nr:hypothetical protein AVEN_178670-1 [Araneus ventricosus]